MIKNFILFLSLAIVLFACYEKRADTQGIIQEIKQREIKRISQADLINSALKNGEKNANELINCLNNGFKSYSVEVINNSKCIDSSSTDQIVQILLCDSLPPQYSNKALLELSDAYLYNFQNKIKATNNVQMNGDRLIFSKPFYFNADSIQPEIDFNKSTNLRPGVIFYSFNKRYLINLF